MPKVFIVNEPLRRDDTGEYVKFLPMESAMDFGAVIKLTPDGNPGSNVREWMTKIRTGLEKDWEDGDFIVLVGDQAMLAYAASVVGEYIAERESNGLSLPTLRFLKWDRRKGAYAPIVLREAESV